MNGDEKSKAGGSGAGNGAEPEWTITNQTAERIGIAGVKGKTTSDAIFVLPPFGTRHVRSSEVDNKTICRINQKVRLFL